MDHLEAEYNMPTGQWWREADHLFDELQGILQLSFDEYIDEIPDQEEPNDPFDTERIEHSPQPLIAVLRSGNHVPRITATNEPLECVAHGTANPNEFLAFFWKSVQTARNNSARSFGRWSRTPDCLSYHDSSV
jgi:hypothetical protein